MEELLFIIILIVVVVGRVLGGVLTESNQKKTRQRQQTRREEPESPYSVPPSTMEGPGPRRTSRPQAAQPRERQVPSRTAQPAGTRTTVRKPPPRPVREQPPVRQPRPVVVRPELRRARPTMAPAKIQQEPVVEEMPAGIPVRAPAKASRPVRPAAPQRGLYLDEDPLVNGILWAEILNEPRCYTSRSPIAGRR